MSARRAVQDNDANSNEGGQGFSALLRELDDGETALPDPTSDAGAAFRYVYDGFVRRGDYDRGKPRHAVRQIKIWLGENQVRSLETKLAGKTWLKYQDAFLLLSLFLKHWKYDKIKNKYTPYQEKNLEEFANFLLKDLFPEDVKAILLPSRTRAKNISDRSEISLLSTFVDPITKTRASGDVIRECFTEGDALVTVSRVRTIIDADPARAMTGFNRLMADLYEIDRKDERKRAAIWIIDLGLRNDKEAARGAIYNLQFLITQFRAISLVDAPKQRQLYNWLRKNACIIVGSLRRDEIDGIYYFAGLDLETVKKDRPWFQSDRLFLESVPGRWLDAEGSEAFGKSQGELWRIPTITAHLRMDDWEDVDHPDELDIRKNLRYFFHGSVKSSQDQFEDVARCIPLPEPGSRWSDAYRLACNAAFARLGYGQEKRISSVGSPEEALTLLRDQHFAALNLNEFLDLPRLLFDLATNH